MTDFATHVLESRCIEETTPPAVSKVSFSGLARVIPADSIDRQHINQAIRSPY